MSATVRDFLDSDLCTETFDAVLGRLRLDDEPYAARIDRIGSPHATPVEFDRLEVFHSLMRNLQQLCGTDESALKWLMQATAFTKAEEVWSSPFEYVAQGDFWALSLLNDITSIIIARGMEMGTDSVNAIFDFREFNRNSPLEKADVSSLSKRKRP